LFAAIGRVLEQQKRLKKLDRYVFQACRTLSNRAARLGKQGLLERFERVNREVMELLQMAVQQSKALDQIVAAIPEPSAWDESPEGLKLLDDKIDAAAAALKRSNDKVAELLEELHKLIERSRRPKK
jgi:hypothetical protein